MAVEQFPNANWTVGRSRTRHFPVIDISEEFENRIVERDRPYRNGAKLDDTGSKARRWNVKVRFDNSITGNGIELNGEDQLYPDVLNEMLASFDEHETGDLVLPTTGRVRARAKRYTRGEAGDEWDASIVTFTWIEDNEDSVGVRQIERPRIKGSARVLTEQTVFSAEVDAVFDLDIAHINELASTLEGALEAPGEQMQDIDQAVGAVVAAVNRVAIAFSTATAGRGYLLDPDSSATQRKLVALADTASRARVEAKPIRTTRILVEADTTLYDLAQLRGNDVQTLINLNPELDPTFVEGGTFVRVLAA